MDILNFISWIKAGNYRTTLPTDTPNLIAVAAKDPSVNHITRMEELPNHFLLELKNFFEQYKVLENKKVEIDNFQDKETACRIIEEAIQYYKVTYKNKL